MTDGLTALYEQCNVFLFNDDVRGLVMDAITELHHSNAESISRLHAIHIDRAIYKYHQASEKRIIWNTLQYFKACIMSALKEYGIDNTE